MSAHAGGFLAVCTLRCEQHTICRCSELCEASDRVSPATAKVLFDVATALFKRIDPENPNSELLDTLLEFAQLACSHCTKGECDAGELR